MCGIIGVFGQSAQAISSPYVTAAVHKLAHRGPNASSIWYSQDRMCLLAHTRLAILDLSPKANQPFSENGFSLCYNGEIYNHQKIRSLSPLKDYPFKTHSDTETLFAAIQKLSLEQTLSLVDGMYAGAFYSNRNKSLSLFRDPLGIKPLYYTQTDDQTIVFSSEIKAIFDIVPDLKRKINLSTLLLYTQYENWPQDKSLFDGIHILKPGEIKRITLDPHLKLQVKSFFCKTKQHNSPRHLVSTNELIRDIQTSLEKSVEDQLLSDVEIGCYLSGGIDSGLVTAITASKLPHVKSFCGYFISHGSWYDERPNAELVAQKVSSQLIPVEITAKNFIEDFDKIIYALDEPRMGVGAFSQYQVLKRAKQYVKVLLAGHGGDELFLGYPIFKAYSFLGHPNLKKFLGFSYRDWPWLLYVLFNKALSGKGIYSPQIFKSIALAKDLARQELPFSGPLTINALRKYFLEIYLPGLLIVEDKISMSMSIETRVPFLSQALCQKMQEINDTILLYNGEPKGLLRIAARKWLPDQIINSPKKGFPTPFRHWVRKELKAFTYERLLESPSALHDIISKKEITELLKEHETIKLPFALDEKKSHKIWILLCLESWLRQFKVSLN